MDSLVDQFENFYSVLLTVLQWKCIQGSHGSLVESFYGLKRIRVDYNSSPSFISTSQKVASLAYLIALPRIMSYLRETAKIIRDRAGSSVDQRMRNEQRSSDPIDTSAASPTLFNNPQNFLSSVYSSLARVQENCALFLANTFPYLEFGGDLSVVGYQLLYLCGSSQYHHPLFALLGMKLVKERGVRTSRAAQDAYGTNSSAATSASNSLSSNWPVIIVLGLVLAVRAAEYLRTNSSTLEANSLSVRLATPIPVPPPPKPGKIGRGCVVPPIDASLCALCAQKRTNSCASNSGYVFCYLCLLPYVRENKSCPVSGLFCDEGSIIRLFEEE